MKGSYWHGIVGICTLLTGFLTWATGALPGHYSSIMAALGAGIVAVDRFSVAHENAAISSTKKAG